MPESVLLSVQVPESVPAELGQGIRLAAELLERVQEPVPVLVLAAEPLAGNTTHRAVDLVAVQAGERWFESLRGSVTLPHYRVVGLVFASTVPLVVCPAHMFGNHGDFGSLLQ